MGEQGNGLGNVQQAGNAPAQQPQEEPPFTFDTAIKINDEFVRKAGMDMKKAGLGTIDREALRAVQEGRLPSNIFMSSNKISENAKDLLTALR